jgi:trigger factor
LNVQTEILENRIAHLKVVIEDEKLQKAKREAARRLSQRVNIPGFRKGKAPYDIVSRYLGEGAILEEAVDELGPAAYREALEQSKLEPYSSGQLENIESEGPFTFVFSVPLVPTVDLGSYRDIRHDYEPPETTDDMVDRAIKGIQDRRAVIEPKSGPAAEGDQVILNIYGAQLPAGTESEEVTDAQAADSESEPESPADKVLFDQKGWRFVLGDEDDEPMPGFSAAVAGIAAGEERTFELTFPENDENYDESLRGKTVSFKVACQEVSTRHVPAINDDFAQQVDEFEAATLLELRIKVRENIQKALEQRAENEYSEQVLDKMVEVATIAYPEIMVEEAIDDQVRSFEQTLRQRKLTLQDFLKFSRMDEKALREQYRQPAIARLKRSLLLGELVKVENLDVDDATLDQEVKERSARLSDGNEEMRTFFEQYLGGERGRRDLAVDLITQRAYRRIAEIGKGENPPIDSTPGEHAGEPEEAAPVAAEEEGQGAS